MIIRVSRVNRHGRQLDHREAAKRAGRPMKYLGSKPAYFIFETHDPSFCAICGVVEQGITLQQLDAGGPLVAVCKRCEEEHPNRGGYDFNGGRTVGTNVHIGTGRKSNGKMGGEMNRTWLYDVLDRELPNMHGHYRDRIAALILEALPQQEIATAIIEATGNILGHDAYSQPLACARAIGAAASTAVIRALGGEA